MIKMIADTQASIHPPLGLSNMKFSIEPVVVIIPQLYE